ncbi:hypothetical protein BT69DRAFT_336501 [Atractiella rhizophila]|nr:hypothetical protein BT69DRAFT_336501 [Atractiella rhizophila]
MAKQCGIAFFDVYEGNNSIIYVVFKRLNRKTLWVLMSEGAITFQVSTYPYLYLFIFLLLQRQTHSFS